VATTAFTTGTGLVTGVGRDKGRRTRAKGAGSFASAVMVPGLMVPEATRTAGVVGGAGRMMGWIFGRDLGGSGLGVSAAAMIADAGCQVGAGATATGVGTGVGAEASSGGSGRLVMARGVGSGERGATGAGAAKWARIEGLW
jgi:hypothetical protein